MAGIRSRGSLRRRAGVLGLAVCMLYAAGFVFQIGVLVSAVHDGLEVSRKGERRTLLDRANDLLPADARFASNVEGAGYVLYPRPEVRVRFKQPPDRVRSRLRAGRVRYLIVALPLPRWLRDASSWTREVGRTKHGVILETAWPTG